MSYRLWYTLQTYNIGYMSLSVVSQYVEPIAWRQ